MHPLQHASKHSGGVSAVSYLFCLLVNSSVLYIYQLRSRKPYAFEHVFGKQCHIHHWQLFQDSMTSHSASWSCRKLTFSLYFTSCVCTVRLADLEEAASCCIGIAPSCSQERPKDKASSLRRLAELQLPSKGLQV